MRITAVTPIHLCMPYSYGDVRRDGDHHWREMETLLVRVDTDTGLVGWGEAFGFNACATTATAITTLIAPLAVGQPVPPGNDLVSRIARRLHNFGVSGPVPYGLSGLDIALWDIAGKAAGVPVCDLLGGCRRTRIPAYASLLRYGDAGLVARHTAEALGLGYRQIKLHEVDPAIMRAARQTAGAETPLMLDANCAWSPGQALSLAPELRELGFAWVEEPIWPMDDIAGLAALRRALRQPIAAGENTAQVADLYRLVAEGAVDVVQPSVTKIGGISALREISARYNGTGIQVCPHSPYFGPGLIATLHVLAAAASDAACEWFYCRLGESMFRAPVAPDSGFFDVPRQPGLGVEPDGDTLERFRKR